jgi:hypothetical protein
LTTISLEALAPADALAPGSASAGTAAAHEQRRAHDADTRERSHRTACKILATNKSPFQCLRGELTGSRRKVALRDALVAIRPSDRYDRPQLGPPFPAVGTARDSAVRIRSRVSKHIGGAVRSITRMGYAARYAERRWTWVLTEKGPRDGRVTGIGFGIAKELAREGARVAISSRTKGTIEAAAQEIEARRRRGPRARLRP